MGGWGWALFGVLLIPAAVVACGQLGMFKGRPPDDLGVRNGRLKPPSTTPNSVSSQAGLHPGHVQQQAAAIAPLALRSGDGPATIDAIARVVGTMKGATIDTRRPDYLLVRFRTPWLGVVDDAEFWFDAAAGVVQVRSASRVGRGDWGVNRARIEAIRKRLGQPASAGWEVTTARRRRRRACGPRCRPRSARR